MFNKIIKYKFWILGVIILILGFWFLGTMLRITEVKPQKGSLLDKAEQSCADGDYKKALDIYKKILILNPNSSSAVLNLAIIYDDYVNNNTRAIELYKGYLELEPESEKKETVKAWIVTAAKESLGIKTKANEANEAQESKISKLKKELKDLSCEKAELEKEIEKLSGKLYTIQAEHQKEIQDLQEQHKRLSELVTNARMRVSDLSKALKNAEEEKKQIKDQMEKEFRFQKGSSTKRQKGIQVNR